MNQAPYPYTRVGNFYTFRSKGKNDIVKIVEFTVLETEYVFNLYFGDLLPDGTVDDTVNSNNGDLIKVLSTVINIAIDFFDRNPRSKVFFAGSTLRRTAMYHRILRMYYSSFSVNFKITATVWQNRKFDEIEFNPMNTKRHFSFFVEKKN